MDNEERLVGEIFTAVVLALKNADVGMYGAMRIMGYVMVALAEAVDLEGAKELETGGF